jgi:hypothetical protein
VKKGAAHVFRVVGTDVLVEDWPALSLVVEITSFVFKLFDLITRAFALQSASDGATSERLKRTAHRLAPAFWHLPEATPRNGVRVIVKQVAGQPESAV